MIFSVAVKIRFGPSGMAQVEGDYAVLDGTTTGVAINPTWDTPDHYLFRRDRQEGWGRYPKRVPAPIHGDRVTTTLSHFPPWRSDGAGGRGSHKKLFVPRPAGWRCTLPPGQYRIWLCAGDRAYSRLAATLFFFMLMMLLLVYIIDYCCVFTVQRRCISMEFVHLPLIKKYPNLVYA
jgi:hypothetical protein